MSNFFSQQTTLVKCVVLVLSFWNPMMEQMGNSGLLSSQDESRNYDIRPRYIKVLHYKQKNNNREHLQRKRRTPLRWISLSNKMIHTLIASTTFLIIHATTIYTWAAKHSRSSRRLAHARCFRIQKKVQFRKTALWCKDLFDRRHNPSNWHCIQMFWK